MESDKQRTLGLDARGAQHHDSRRMANGLGEANTSVDNERLRVGSNRITFRDVTEADSELLLQWRNLPDIATVGRTQRTVEVEEHTVWLQQILASKGHLLVFVLIDGTPAGQVRFDPAQCDACYVSFFLLSAYRGLGLGWRVLQQACWNVFTRLRIEKVLAEVRRDNAPSNRCFQKVGFLATESQDREFRHYCFNKPPQVPHNRLTFDEEEVSAVAKTIRSGHWSSGPQVRVLENHLKEITGVHHAIAVSSGVSALRLALIAMGVGAGDHVIVPAYCCVALPNAVLSTGATPVPVDVDPTWNIDPTEVAAAVDKVKPKAIIAVNTFGVPADVKGLEKWRIPVIEDCAHALGMGISRQPLGGRSTLAITSFYATKLVGCGEGGAVMTNSEEYAAKIRRWRDYSDQPATGTRLNDKLTDLEASLASVQLQRLPSFLESRKNIAERFTTLLADERDANTRFKLPVAGDRVWYRYVVQILFATVDDVIEQMGIFGVSATRPVEPWIDKIKEGFPKASRAYDTLLSLPIYPTLSNAEQDRCVHAFQRAIDIMSTK